MCLCWGWGGRYVCLVNILKKVIILIWIVRLLLIYLAHKFSQPILIQDLSITEQWTTYIRYQGFPIRRWEEWEEIQRLFSPSVCLSSLYSSNHLFRSHTSFRSRILVRAISYTVHGLIPASCVFADRYNREEVVRSLGKEVNINPPLVLGQLPDTPEELLKLDQVSSCSFIDFSMWYRFHFMEAYLRLTYAYLVLFKQ